VLNNKIFLKNDMGWFPLYLVRVTIVVYSSDE